MRAWLTGWLICLLVSGGAALAQNLQAQNLQTIVDAPPADRFEQILPADGLRMLIRPYATSYTRMLDNKRGGAIWALFYHCTPEGLAAGQDQTCEIRKYRTKDEAIAGCRRMLETWRGISGHTQVDAAPRIAGYECHGAVDSGGVMRTTPHGVPPYAWRQRDQVFTRGVYLVWLDQTMNAGADAPVSLPRTTTLGVLADRLDTLDPAGGLPQQPQQAAAPPAKKPAPATKAPPKPAQQLTAQEKTYVTRLLGTPQGQLLLSALAATGITGMGALLLMARAGMSSASGLDDLQNLLRGRLPEDPFAAWQAKYSGLGWRYTEEGGVGHFLPVAGCRDDQGRIYDPASGQFVAEPVHHDGETNPQTGEVWSDEDHGWVGRGMYEWEKRNAADFERLKQHNRTHTGAWDAATGKLAHDIAAQKAEMAAQAAAKARIKAGRDMLDDALGVLRARDRAAGDYDPNRAAVLGAMSDKLANLGANGDYVAALNDFNRLGGAVLLQSRAGYQPTYTYKDAVFDTALQSGALALDTFVTRGAALTLVDSGLAARNVAREGGSAKDMLAAGFKAGIVDAAFAGAGELIGVGARWLKGSGGSLSPEALSLIANRDAAIALREGAEGGLVEASQHNLAALKQEAAGGRASLGTVLDMQANPHQVRALKQGGTTQMQEAFNATLRNDVYRPHDLKLQLELEGQFNRTATSDKLKIIEVQEIRTPGAKANPLNTDRDFRVLESTVDRNGNIAPWKELPKEQWKGRSDEIFADLTGFDPAKAPSNLSAAEQRQWWAEKHGFTGTDYAHAEAGRDYSDQIADLATGRRNTLPVGANPEVGTTSIEQLKQIAHGDVPTPQTPLRLHDAEGLGLQYQEKITGNLRRGDSFEALAQAQKGIGTLEAVQTAYGRQGLTTGVVSDNFTAAANLIKNSSLGANPDAAALKALQSQLSGLGIHGIGDFANKLSGQFNALKWAK